MHYTVYCTVYAHMYIMGSRYLVPVPSQVPFQFGYMYRYFISVPVPSTFYQYIYRYCLGPSKMCYSYILSIPVPVFKLPTILFITELHPSMYSTIHANHFKYVPVYTMAGISVIQIIHTTSSTLNSYLHQYIIYVWHTY